MTLLGVDTSPGEGVCYHGGMTNSKKPTKSVSKKAAPKKGVAKKAAPKKGSGSANSKKAPAKKAPAKKKAAPKVKPANKTSVNSDYVEVEPQTYVLESSIEDLFIGAFEQQVAEVVTENVKKKGWLRRLFRRG